MVKKLTEIVANAMGRLSLLEDIDEERFGHPVWNPEIIEVENAEHDSRGRKLLYAAIKKRAPERANAFMLSDVSEVEVPGEPQPTGNLAHGDELYTISEPTFTLRAAVQYYRVR